MPTTTQTQTGQSTTTNRPSGLQDEIWGGIVGAGGQLVWPGGNFALAPQYGGNLTAPMSPAMLQYLRQTGGLAGTAPDFSGVQGNANVLAQQASAGIRNPDAINFTNNYQPTQFNVPQFQMNDPFAGYQGGGPGMQVQA